MKLRTSAQEHEQMPAVARHKSPPQQHYLQAQHPKQHQHVQTKLASDWLGRLRRWRQFDADSQSTLAECFDAAYVSRMTVPDSEPSLPSKRVLKVTDPWRHEWQRGVQVAIDSERLEPTVHQLPPVSATSATTTPTTPKAPPWRLPPRHFLRTEPPPPPLPSDGLDTAGSRGYCSDELDARWTRLSGVRPDHLEAVVTAAEAAAHARLRASLRCTVGLGIEYDASVACSACMSPEANADNEIVFCDGCDAAVHQACYGIVGPLPSGAWLCQPCSRGVVRPPCALCPAGSAAGIMKATRDSNAWCHVSCALWMPEVTFGDPSRLELVAGLAEVPQWRRALLCRVCRQRGDGACVRCGVRRCQAAFHVGCLAAEAKPSGAFQQRQQQHRRGGLLAAVEAPAGRAALGRKYLVYCARHADTAEAARAMGRERQWRRRRALLKRKPAAVTTASVGVKGDRQRALLNRRNMRLMELQANFHSLVSQADLARALAPLRIEDRTVSLILDYWRLKRTANGCRPLLAPLASDCCPAAANAAEEPPPAAVVVGGNSSRSSSTSTSSSSSPASSSSAAVAAAAAAAEAGERRRHLVRLRLDLERVRNLCYLVVRREKAKRALALTLGQLATARLATATPVAEDYVATTRDDNNNTNSCGGGCEKPAKITGGKSAVKRRSGTATAAAASALILRHRLRRHQRQRRPAVER